MGIINDLMPWLPTDAGFDKFVFTFLSIIIIILVYLILKSGMFNDN